MHKWESTEKLVHEWERQEIGDPYIYDDFKYSVDEFDNVPPVIPRFQFYLQLSLKPVVEHVKKLRDAQQVHELREETKGLIKDVT